MLANDSMTAKTTRGLTQIVRNRWNYFRSVGDYLGLLLWVFVPLLAVGLAVRWFFAARGHEEVSTWTFAIPMIVSIFLGALLKRNLKSPPLDNRRAMILCATGWIVLSFVGAIPFYVGTDMGFFDAYFETVSGFTTTGFTMLTELSDLPPSILFWRSFTQWLGGLGILTFFLAVLYTGGSAHRLFGAESHKVFAKRPTPNLFKSLRILWLIYVFFTAAVAVALILEGLGRFEAVMHAMTTLSTGGYSSHDASIAYFRQSGFENFILIEYTIIVGMILGGISFFVHYRLLRGGLRAIWDSLEMRLMWIMLLGATILVMVDHFQRFGFVSTNLHDVFRNSLFQTTALLTTTGFATKDIGGEYFPAASKLIFLMLMVVGGCVGSTAGGLKILRIGVMFAMLKRQVHRLIYGPAAIQPVVVDGDAVDAEELRRIATLVFAWFALIGFGAVVTALLSGHDALSAASGMFSAVGNIGPCYIPVGEISALHPLIKITYILGMLAGRLEILPVLLLFSGRTWR